MGPLVFSSTSIVWAKGMMALDLRNSDITKGPGPDTVGKQIEGPHYQINQCGPLQSPNCSSLGCN